MTGAATRRTMLAGGFMLPAAVVFGQSSAAPMLSAREAFEAARDGRILMVDIRAPSEWADTGLPQGAIPLELDAPAFDVRLAGLRLDNPGKRIALIDRSGALASATMQKLGGRGWRDLAAVRGGMLGPGGWLAEGLPVKAYP